MVASWTREVVIRYRSESTVQAYGWESVHESVVRGGGRSNQGYLLLSVLSLIINILAILQQTSIAVNNN